MSLPFNPSTPQASQTVAATQPLLLQNNSSLGTVFNNVNTGGNFTNVYLQNTAAALSGGTLPMNPLSIYHAVNGTGQFSGVPIPYFANSSGDFPILPDVTTSGSLKGFLLGSVIINWGTFSLSTNPTVITFTIPFTGTDCGVCITPESVASLSGGPISYHLTTTQLTVYPGTGLTIPVNCSFTVIGT